jgi:protein tyrosine phosphatase (PTP) superfamily phosphohydrolase (DUF442 family)
VQGFACANFFALLGGVGLIEGVCPTGKTPYLNIMSEIKNFLTISDRLACAGQPDELQLAEIAARGFQVVINLGLSDGKYALPNEADSVTGLGLSYFHIPVLFDNPRIAEWESFRSVMDQQQVKKVFVHCAANYRATAFTGLYLFAKSELTREELHSFISQVWQPDAVWLRFIDEALKYIAECRG